MGYEVFTSILVPIDCAESEKQKTLAELATKHFKIFESDEEWCGNKTVLHFLQSVKDQRCIFSSSKGWGLAWAAEGNYCNAEDIVEELKLFFLDLYQNRIALRFNHIIVITSPIFGPEDKPPTTVVEIGLNSEGDYKVRFGKEITLNDMSINSYEAEWKFGPRY